MDNSNYPAAFTDDAIVARLYDLSRSGETACNEFLELDHRIVDGLQRAYGGEIYRLQNLAA